MNRSRISGMGFYVPKNVITNHDLSQRMDTSDEWIQERTGVQERRYFTPGEDTVANMAANASRMAIAQAGLVPEDIDFIIFATLSPDYFFPGSGVLLQRELGIQGKGIGAMDIRNQCSGFIYALSVADQFIQTGRYKNILVAGSEIHSSGLEYTDRGRHVSVIFGDGAGAVVLSPATREGQGILTTHLHADGEHAEQLAVVAPSSNFINRKMGPEYFENGEAYPLMNGRYVFKFAVSKFPEVILEALAATGLTVSDIDLVIPHQANLRISEAVRHALDLPEEKIFNNIMKYGNTTAASIPIAMCEAWEAGKIKEGNLVCLAAFGSGFTWASALIRW